MNKDHWSPSDLIRFLSEARAHHSMSQAALAQHLGLTQAQISRIERGRSDPRVSTLHNIAGALDLQLVLVPRQLGPVVSTLVADFLETQQDADHQIDVDRPLYRLEADDAAVRDSQADVPR